MLAREVGDEWALSKQHLAQEVPIGSFTQRKEVCLVCVCECTGKYAEEVWM